MMTHPRAPLAPHSRAPASHPPAVLVARPARWRRWLWLLALAVSAVLLPSLGGQPAHAAPLVDSFSPLPSSGTGNALLFGFQGGWIQPHPEVYLDFWGPLWKTDSTAASTELQIINTFKTLGGGQYNNILTDYYNPTDMANPDDYVHNDVSYMGYMNDQNTPSGSIFSLCGVPVPGLGLGAEGPLHLVYGNCAIRNEAVHALQTMGGQPDQTGSTQVLVFPQQGTSYQFPSCGMHSYDSWDYSNSFTYAYAVYSDSASQCMVGSLDTAQSTAFHAVHEYAESATDPNIYLTANNAPIHGSGWNTDEAIGVSINWSGVGVQNPSPHEMGDLCENYVPVSGDIYDIGKQAFVQDSYGINIPWPTYHPTNTGLSLYLPFLWSRSANGCVMSKGEEFSSPGTSVHTVQEPILSAYNGLGGPTSFLGYPTREQFPFAPSVPIVGDQESTFQNGFITKVTSSGMTTVYSTVGYASAAIAYGERGGTCNQYYGCPNPGEWCSDFARWVWASAGVANVSDLNGAAASFYDYGMRYSTLSPTPHVGDAVVIGYNPKTNWAQHVAIVISVDSINHTITSYGGNERGGNGVVAPDSYDWTVAYSSYWSTNISGYISPKGTFPGVNSLGGGSSGGSGGTGAVPPPPPGGSSPQSNYTAPTAHYLVDTFASATGYGAGGAPVGTLYAATNYVFCKAWGNVKSDSAGNYNHWWMWTDLDTGGKGWVSAYYLTRWGNDEARDNSGVVLPTCWPGTAPIGSYSKWYVNTFATAPGMSGTGSNWQQVGTLYAATNYVFCKAWGPEISDSAGNYNHWWMWTDLDTGGQGWVSAYYLSLWGNDVANDNSGNVIPNC